MNRKRKIENQAMGRIPHRFSYSLLKIFSKFMTRKSIFISLLLVNTSVVADANDGEYLGFTLGQSYSVPRGAVAKDHIIGALDYAVDPHQRAQHLGSLSIYVSPGSSVIGSIFGGWYFTSERAAKSFLERYTQILDDEYGDWKRHRILFTSVKSFTNGKYQLWVDFEQKPSIVDHWPSDKKYRVGVALTYALDSSARNNWIAMINLELGRGKLTARN
jgi:hypothetical protein